MYIEREALLERLKFKRDCVGRISNYPGLESAISQVKKAPAADVAPVVHGEWVNVVHALVDTTGDCTKCGKQAVWRTKNKPYVICPNCGAKMDGDNNQ